MKTNHKSLSAETYSRGVTKRASQGTIQVLSLTIIQPSI